MHKLKLETDYNINGNSTGCTLDTLAIAVQGQDSNDIDWNNESRIETEKYVLENYNYEADMLKEATKAQLKEWLKDPQDQESALDEYTEKRKEAITSGEDCESELYTQIQKAIEAQSEQDYKEWLYGDYRNYAGLFAEAYKRYNVTFTEEKGEVFADIPQETIDEWIDYERLPKKHTIKQALAILEEQINSDAHAQYQNKLARHAKNKLERERQAEYQEKCAQEAEAQRQATLKALIKNAK